MVRILITYVLPLVLPTLAWYVWGRLSASRTRTERNGSEWENAPWPALAVSGVVLLAATLGALALFGAAEPGNVYRPARVVDGAVVPGTQTNAPPQPYSATE